MNIERKFARQQGFTGTKCPKCGKRTLVKRVDTNKTEKDDRGLSSVWVTCETCGFEFEKVANQ